MVRKVFVKHLRQCCDEMTGQCYFVILDLLGLSSALLTLTCFSSSNRWFSGGRLPDAAHHDLDKAGLLLVVQGLLGGARFLDQQIRHALPVLHHWIAFNQRIHQVTSMLMKLRFNEECHKIFYQRSVWQPLFFLFSFSDL